MTTEADALKGKYFRVLDDGFVGFVDYMGNDDAIDQAARVSYGTGTRKVSDRRTLIRYLSRNRHSSPQEMVELKFHIRIPMDAHRQLVR
jgi:thymidylate synthase (FAD)